MALLFTTIRKLKSEYRIARAQTNTSPRVPRGAAVKEGGRQATLRKALWFDGKYLPVDDDDDESFGRIRVGIRVMRGERESQIPAYVCFDNTRCSSGCCRLELLMGQSSS